MYATTILDQIKCYMLGKGLSILGPPSEADRVKHYRLFELIAAGENNMIMWENLPPSTFENCDESLRRFNARGRRPRDYGIDCANFDLSRVCQAKWYAPNSTVKFRDLSTFNTLSEIADSQEMILSTSEGVKTHSLTSKLFSSGKIRKSTITDDTIDETCSLATLWESDDDSADTAADNAAAQNVLVPRAWQAEALPIVCAKMSDTGTARICVTCGAGKSLFMMMVVDANAYRNSVVFVPTISLIHQLKREIRKWFPTWSVNMVGGGYCETGQNGYTTVTICTYQSAHLLTDVYDFVCIDEAHHIADDFTTISDDMRAHAKAVFAHTTNDETHTLLVSATMYDECDYSYGISRAVEDDVVVDYHMVIPLFSDGDVKLGLIKMMLDHPEWTRILAYCNTIHEAVTFNTLCNKLGVISETFDGSTPVRDRKASIRRLESGETRVLTTVQTINEGTDIPSADTCMFVEPRNGHVTVTQCVGRVLRKCAATGKTVATVVLPTVDEERELVRFMRVMIKSDTRIGGDAWKSGGRSTIICDTGDIESATLLSESMYDRLGNAVNGAWEEKYSVLQSYVDENTCLPKRSAVCDDIKIGWWCNAQRISHRKGKLSAERIAKLEDVPGWYWRKYNC